MSRSLHSKDAEAVYLRTGDLGFVWKGELYFVSRLKDLVVVHGRNVIPDDVELVIDERLAEDAGTVFATSVRPLGLELNVAKSPTYFQLGGDLVDSKPAKSFGVTAAV